MKVRWREHEMLLVTIIAVIALAGYSWNVHKTPIEAFAGPFFDNHVPFNLVRNVVMPDLGLSLLIYLAYLFINLFTIPRLLPTKKMEAGTFKVSLSFKTIVLQGTARNMVKKYAALFAQILLMTLLLGTALNISTYYKHQWQFGYPGFSIFFDKNNPRSQMDVYEAYALVLFVIAVYAVYVLFRQAIIYLVQTSGPGQSYNTLICNKITTFAVVYFTVPVFLLSFNIIHEHSFFLPWYYLVVLALFLMFISNIFWLFPLKANGPFFRKEIVLRLLISSFFFSLPLIVSIHEGFFIAFLYAWAFQLFVVTPLTWLFYQQDKDRILQLRGAQKALVKSKADLQFLRSQINPHFLFNTLNTLYGTALQENAERTAGGIQKLGDMMRFMLHENNLDTIMMSREIEYLQNYISLQKLRTQSSPGIVIEHNIQEAACNHNIAPMLLIPLVENAFKHGISLTEKSWIKINLHCNEQDIFFEIRNSIHSHRQNNPEKEPSGIGFKNVIERLKLIYPGKHQVTVNNDGKEFFVSLTIQP